MTGSAVNVDGGGVRLSGGIGRCAIAKSAFEVLLGLGINLLDFTAIVCFPFAVAPCGEPTCKHSHSEEFCCLSHCQSHTAAP